MKRNNLLDFLILLLFSIALSSIPFKQFISLNWLVLALQIFCQILIFVSRIYYVKKKSDLNIQTKKINWTYSLLLIPTLVVCFSNYFYLALVPDDISINFNYLIILDIILTICVAVNEEILFRLIFINNLENKSNVFKVFVSAAVFSLSHIVVFLSSFNPFDLLQLVYTFALGILLGIAFVLTNSVYPCIVIHFLFNVFNSVVYTSISKGPSDFWKYILANGAVATFAGLYLAIILIIIYRKFSKNEEVLS